MKNCDNAPGELIDEVESLFDTRRDVCLVLDSNNCIVGACGGVFGLRLIANCLCEQFDHFGEAKPRRRLAASSKRVARIRKQLAGLAARRDAWFIAFFQFGEGADWEMAWSDELDHDDVYREAIGFVRNGWLPDMGRKV
jgi:hypothetical protein